MGKAKKNLIYLRNQHPEDSLESTFGKIGIQTHTDDPDLQVGIGNIKSDEDPDIDLEEIDRDGMEEGIPDREDLK